MLHTFAHALRDILTPAILILMTGAQLAAGLMYLLILTALLPLKLLTVTGLAIYFEYKQRKGDY
jgi:hypothetical protein